MRLHVSRTSNREDSVSPCKEAYRASYICDGVYYADFDDEDWFVDVESLEELAAFIDQHGRVVVSPALAKPPALKVEIYDDHRE